MSTVSLVSPADADEHVAPTWMAALLLWSSGAGLLLLLNAARIAFAGEPSRGAPAGLTLADVRFIDLATTWVAGGVGSAVAWSTFAAVTGFAVIAAVRRHQNAALPARFRLAGLTVSGLLTVLEVSGPVTVLMGYQQLLEDPTSARDLAAAIELLGPYIVTTLILAVLSGCLTVTLWRDQTFSTRSTKGAQAPTLTPDANITDRVGMYERPR